MLLKKNISSLSCLIFAACLYNTTAAAEETFMDFDAGSGTSWQGWTWHDDVKERGGGSYLPGWKLNSDGPFGGEKTYLWGEGPRNFQKGSSYDVDILAEIDTSDRAPSTDSGGCFRAYDTGNVENYRTTWWMWYDGEPLSEKTVTDSATDRWEFYLKTENSTPITDDGGTNSVSNYNFIIGTYICWNDGWSSYGQGQGCPYEGPGNQHYYHYLTVNPGAWINVQLDQHPQHKRSSFVKGNNPTYTDPLHPGEGLNEDSHKNYLEHLHQFYIELGPGENSHPTEMKIDEMKFYSTQDTVEPNQNEESIVSPWVGYWPDQDHWEIGWHDMSRTDENGHHRNENAFSTFGIRWSTSPITNENFDQAHTIDPLFYGGVEYTGEAHLVRRPSPHRSVAWTRFKLPDDIEQNNNRIYFAIKDVSVAGGHVGTLFPYNRSAGDDHDAPSSSIRTIDYYLRPDVQSGTEAGDVNGDGKVELVDVILAVQITAGLKPADTSVDGEGSGDGCIGIAEAIMVLRKSSGLTAE